MTGYFEPFFLVQAEDEEERQKTEVHRLLASEQRSALTQLYSERQRPSMDNDVSNKRKFILKV